VTDRPADPGLQPERTGLAWQRTALSLGGGALVYSRIAAPTVENWAWLLAGLGLLAALVIGVWGRRRYDYTHRTLTRGGRILADGLLPAVVAGTVAAAGIVVLVLSLLAL